MEVHRLRYFCAVARTGSFTRAAQQEGVAQPTLSQQVRKLERALGAALFERRGRSVRLTEAGRRLLPRAQEVLRQMADARRIVEGTRDTPKGRLVVGAIPTVMPYLLAPRVGEFRERYPDVDLHLVEHVTAHLVEGLQSGDIDLAVMSLAPVPPDLVRAELVREPLLVAVPPGHRLEDAGEIDATELREERLLMLREGHCFRGDALKVCRRGRVDGGATFEADQFASIFALVSAGFGVSLVPQMATAAAGACRLVRLRRPVYRRVGYVYARRAFVPPAERAFVAWLKGASRGG